MKPNILISEESTEWNNIKNAEALICTAILSAYKEAKKPEELLQIETEISLTLTDNRDIQLINKEYRGIDKATNVLSFPQLELKNGVLIDENEFITPPSGNPVMLGDIIMAYEIIIKEAKEQEKTIESHLTHLAIHGLLHLLGYDHIDNKEAAEMEQLEVNIMNHLGYNSPYSDIKNAS